MFTGFDGFSFVFCKFYVFGYLFIIKKPFGGPIVCSRRSASQGSGLRGIGALFRDLTNLRWEQRAKKHVKILTRPSQRRILVQAASPDLHRGAQSRGMAKMRDPFYSSRSEDSMRSTCRFPICFVF